MASSHVASLPHENGWPLPPAVPSFSSLDARDLPTDAEQIEKDLHRAGRLELGITDTDVQRHYIALRRLLRAWCQLAPYSQAMSRVGATLLLTTDHDAEKAFTSFAWLMSAMPKSYYDTGYMTDVRALRLLAAWRWPDVIVPSLYEPLELVSSAWFLSLWAGVLPADCCVAIWAQLVLSDDADEPSAGGETHHYADTSLRVALVLLDESREAIAEAVEMDAADADAGAVVTDGDGDDAPGFSAATYVALQQAARWDAGVEMTSALVSKLTALQLTSETVAEARRLAASQLEAEAAKRAREKAAARERAQEAREREERMREREEAAESGQASTSTRLGEQQLEAYAAEVSDTRANRAAKKESRAARAVPIDPSETQIGDLQEVRSHRNSLASCSCGGGTMPMLAMAVQCLFVVPACLLAIGAALVHLLKRCFGRSAGAVGETRRRTRRRAPLADKDGERASAAERGIELSDTVASEAL